MNIKEAHKNERPVSAINIFKGDHCIVTAIQILKDQQLKEHVTKALAFLICIEGEALFENEKGVTETLKTGDYVIIEPDVKHKVSGITDCQLTLLK